MNKGKHKIISSVIAVALVIIMIVSAIGCGSCSCVVSQPTASSTESQKDDSSEELTETNEEPASGEDDTTEKTEDDETESSEPAESDDETTESTEDESETEVESESGSEDETNESSNQKETEKDPSGSSKDPTQSSSEVSHSATPTSSPTTAPTAAPHQHTWKTEQVLVSAAYDEQVETKAAWDEIYLVFVDVNGQTQRIRVPDKRGGTVTYPLEWDEEIYEVHDLCNFPGCTFDYTAYMREHNCVFDVAAAAHMDTPENLNAPPEQQHGGWHRENVLVNVIHHTTDTMNYYSTDTFETIHHPAEYTTVHHDAVYKTVRKCTVCGKIEE